VGKQHERETETSRRKECKQRKLLRPEPALPSSSSFQKTRNEEEEECRNENSSRRKERIKQGTFERTREGEKE